MARIIAVLLFALFAGIANAVVVVPANGQCGGTSKSKAVKSVLGGPFAGFVCQTGYVCKVQNPFYAQCVPGVVKKDIPVVLPKPVKGVKGCTWIVKRLTQCAGRANVPKGLKIGGGEKWPGVCCPTGIRCIRQNKFYSQCGK